MSILAFQGAAVVLPGGTTLRLFDERIPCSPAPSERVIELTDDAQFDVVLDGLDAVHAFHLTANNPVTIVLTSVTGDAQLVPVESMHIVSREVPFTAISLVRVAGQATTVRLILGQEA